MQQHVFRFAQRATIVVALLGALLLGALSGVVFVYSGDLPQISALDDQTLPTISRVYAADGSVIGEFAVERRLLVRYDDIPEVLRNAIIAAEDGGFFGHTGMRVSRMALALVYDLVPGTRGPGRSTLTQQLARHLFPIGFARTWERKIKESILTVQIEKRYAKEEIFTRYCNMMYFGHGAYGVEAASRLYFNKSVNDLALEEAALIAGILQSPERLSPYASMDRARARRDSYVLPRMVKEGFITPAEAEAGRQQPIVVAGERPLPLSSPAPYFVERVRQSIQETYGARQVYEGGLQIRTSLNLELQEAANAALDAGLARLNEGRRNPTIEGAVLAIDNRTGHILAMIGGSDFTTTKFNRAVQAYRQLGSTFKPVVYTAAVDRGYTATTMLLDEPAFFPAGPGQPLYSPRNYDRRFEGPVTLRRALELSRNVPTVRLADELGPQQMVEYAKRLGFTSEVRPYLSSAIGASEATLLEVTSAFSVFPNQGVRMRPYGIVSVTDRSGSVLQENRPDPVVAIRADTAYVMVNLLSGVVARGTAARVASLNWPLGGKTGTTNDYTDAWFIGFDPDVTIGVWIGYDKKERMGSMTGAVAALPIWMDVMRAHIAQHGDDEPRPEFASPGNIVFVQLDNGIREAFIAGTQPGAAFGDSD